MQACVCEIVSMHMCACVVPWRLATEGRWKCHWSSAPRPPLETNFQLMEIAQIYTLALRSVMRFYVHEKNAEQQWKGARGNSVSLRLMSLHFCGWQRGRAEVEERGRAGNNGRSEVKMRWLKMSWNGSVWKKNWVREKWLKLKVASEFNCSSLTLRDWEKNKTRRMLSENQEKSRSKKAKASVYEIREREYLIMHITSPHKLTITKKQIYRQHNQSIVSL